MQTKNRGVIIAIIIIVSLFVIEFCFWLSYQKPPVKNPEILILSKHPEWKVQSDSVNGYTFKYPQIFGANVWRPLTWPPAVTVVAKDQDPVKLGCPNYTKEESNNPAGATGSINSLNYKLYQSAGVGAGNLYNEFCYVYSGVDKYYVLNVEINSHTACGESCGAYCDTPFEQECATLDRKSDIEQPIQDVADSFKLIK